MEDNKWPIKKVWIKLSAFFKRELSIMLVIWLILFLIAVVMKILKYK
jgi:hypothetical protein